MKFVLKISASLILLWLVFFLVYSVTLMWNPFAIQKKTTAFLGAIQAQKYEKATNLYSGTIDKKTWVHEMLKLYEEEGFRLLSYDNVKADYDDGAFNTGHADLTFQVDGKALKVRAILTFGSGAKPNQVCAIHPPEVKPGSIPELVLWNQLVCGGSF
jgi:hypothetical protein